MVLQILESIEDDLVSIFMEYACVQMIIQV